ncbi:hypothetical protein WA026_000101 [Henosepilachna vigintioctopunctata]|uniref:HMG box domain-containing protein n=1 Tax=Henosepilachna vigintioctopunctata TaxID=420089 RepID=A0AAW1V341_9CUCU
MANITSKHVSASKRQTKTQPKKKRGPVTPNPFLNFFLDKCNAKQNSKLHKFAQKISEEWIEMNYTEKTPYYQLADKVRKKKLERMCEIAKKKKNRYDTSKNLQDSTLEFCPYPSFYNEDNSENIRNNETFQEDFLEDNATNLNSSDIVVSQMHDQELISKIAKKVDNSDSISKFSVCSKDIPSFSSNHSLKNYCCLNN